MTSKIYIASSAASIIPNAHTYLIYDTDGDINTFNDQYVINAGPNGGIFSSNIGIDSNELLQNIDPTYWIDTDNDGIADRDPKNYFNYTELDLNGISASNIWAVMVGYADSIILSNPITYNPIGYNSNAVTSSVLSAVGIDFEVNTPRENGIGPSYSASNYPGYNNIIGGIGNDVLHGYGGNDTIIDFGGGSYRWLW